MNQMKPERYQNPSKSMQNEFDWHNRLGKFLCLKKPCNKHEAHSVLKIPVIDVIQFLCLKSL